MHKTFVSRVSRGIALSIITTFFLCAAPKIPGGLPPYEPSAPYPPIYPQRYENINQDSPPPYPNATLTTVRNHVKKHHLSYLLGTGLTTMIGAAVWVKRHHTRRYARTTLEHVEQQFAAALTADAKLHDAVLSFFEMHGEPTAYNKRKQFPYCVFIDQATVAIKKLQQCSLAFGADAYASSLAHRITQLTDLVNQAKKSSAYSRELADINELDRQERTQALLAIITEIDNVYEGALHFFNNYQQHTIERQQALLRGIVTTFFARNGCPHTAQLRHRFPYTFFVDALTAAINRLQSNMMQDLPNAGTALRRIEQLQELRAYVYTCSEYQLEHMHIDELERREAEEKRKRAEEERRQLEESRREEEHRKRMMRSRSL